MPNISQKGETIEFQNTTGSTLTVRSPAAVGDRVVICADDIPDTEVGVGFTTGVHTFPKVSGAVIAVGEKCLFDVSAGEVDDRNATAASGDITDGLVAWESAGAGVTTIQCKLTDVGTRTP